MARNERVLRERRIEAAGGYLMLEMPDQALGVLSEINDPEKCPFELNKLRGEAFVQKKQHEKGACSIITDGFRTARVELQRNSCVRHVSLLQLRCAIGTYEMKTLETHKKTTSW